MSEYVIDMSNSSYQSTSGLLCADVSQLREEIIRCRNCEFAAYEGTECMRVDEWDSSLWFPVEPNGFCKWGEKNG